MDARRPPDQNLATVNDNAFSDDSRNQVNRLAIDNELRLNMSIELTVASLAMQVFQVLAYPL